MDGRRVITNVLAIIARIAVWALCVTVGMRIATRLLPPVSQDGYHALVGLLGVRRSIPIFVTCGALVGFGITLAPLLPWPKW